LIYPTSKWCSTNPNFHKHAHYKLILLGWPYVE
jgi:hypothetical protein